MIGSEDRSDYVIFEKYQGEAFKEWAESSDRRIKKCHLRSLKLGPDDVSVLDNVLCHGVEFHPAHQSIQAIAIRNGVLKDCQLLQDCTHTLLIRGTEIEGLTAVNCSIQNSSFCNASLKDSDLRSSGFFNTVFYNCGISGIDFGWSTFNNCTFSSQYPALMKAALNHASFVRSVFHNFSFVDVESFDMSSFEECQFIGCSLTSSQRQYVEASRSNIVIDTSRLVEAVAIARPATEPAGDGHPVSPSHTKEELTRGGRFGSIELIE